MCELANESADFIMVDPWELCSGMDENAVGISAKLIFASIDATFADDAPLLPSGFHIAPHDTGKEAIPTRGGVHGLVEPVPHVPTPGSRGFGAGHGSANNPIRSHLSHQQSNQQTVGNIGSSFSKLLLQ